MTAQQRAPVAASVTGMSTSDSYVVSTEAVQHTLRAEISGEAIVESRKALALYETRHSPVYYFPKEDVRMDLLSPTEHRTHCPFKGDATYWSLTVGGRTLENVAWSYESPYPDASEITGYIAFYTSKIDAWWEDGKCVSPARVNAAPMPPANPLARWVISEAWEAATSRDLTARFARQLTECGVSVLHLRVIIPTLHPMIAATSYRWMRGNDKVERFDVGFDLAQDDKFLKSPIASVFQGLGGIRRWIGPEDDNDDFPILADLREVGATDYVAMPIRFSDGQINAVTMATDQPGGFTTEQLGWVHEILPPLSRYYEVHAKRRASETLMKTFLGQHTGRRVLDGLIRRGDGETIHAVIWFCDLRNSTPIAESMGREAFLDYLNRFFDCMAGAVLDQGGEVLRFIGDAVMAIFPIGEQSETAMGDGRSTACKAYDACNNAAAAAREAGRRIAEANKTCVADGMPEMHYGIGMHVGDVTYGNIGTQDRLEFTVIGRAANEAARIEALTKDLAKPVIVSQPFADVYMGNLENLGEHTLRGVDKPQTVYALPVD